MIEFIEKLFEGTAENLGEEEKCIVSRTEDDFFAAGGRFVALFSIRSSRGNGFPANPSVTTRSVLKSSM